MTEITPGSWHGEEAIMESKRERTNKIKAPVYSPDLIAQYTLFRNHVYNPQSVLYPSCGFDASASKVFENVTYVDKEAGNEGCIEVLQNAGHHALKQDIREYCPTAEHDLVILLNPSINTAWATQHLKQGGFVISNNYHGNARWMFERPEQFKIEGGLSGGINSRPVVLTRDVKGFFEPFANIEELLQCKPELFTTQIKPYLAMSNASKNTPEEIAQAYRLAKRTLGESEALPSKRLADSYIFQKK